jgi:acetyl esterase/lipase
MVRLVLLILLFLISLLAVCPAPAYYLWLLAVAVTEYPLIFVAIAAGLTAWGIWLVPYKTAGNVIGLITILLFLSPVVRAYRVGDGLRAKIALAFAGCGNPPVFPARVPFSFGGLLKTTPKVSYKTLTYATYKKSTRLTLDYYLNNGGQQQQRVELVPNHDTPPIALRPCVIVVHGGSWSSGDSRQLPELNSFLAQQGYNVASINYRMAPKYQTPVPIEDIKNAITYLTRHAAALHIDTNQFVLLGRSAGAQIALLAAYTLQDKRIKGVIDFYGPADMVWGYAVPSNPLIMDSRGVMERYIGGPYKQVPEKYKACSPIEFVDGQTMPTLIIHGDNDVLVSPEHSRRLNLKLQQHHIRHYWLKLPWATHGFDFNINGPGGQLSTYAVETFLNTITRTP